MNEKRKENSTFLAKNIAKHLFRDLELSAPRVHMYIYIHKTRLASLRHVVVFLLDLRSMKLLFFAIHATQAVEVVVGLFPT